MAVKFFGQFLLERGVVSRELLLNAVELQESVNLKFGETALDIKLITENDVRRIHDAQRSQDLMFGDMAEKLGILTKDQIAQVLAHQQKSHLRIGEALVQVGALAAEELPRHLEAFRLDQAPYATAKLKIPEGVPNGEVWEICADLSAKMFTRMVGIPCHLGECGIADVIAGGSLVAALDLRGGVSARYHLAVSPEVRNRIARVVLLEESVEGESDEVLDDTVLEFVNIVCGNVAAKSAQLGKDVQILPPLALHPDAGGIAVPAGEKALSFPLHLADGETAAVTILIRI